MRILPTTMLALALALSLTAPALAEKGGNGKGNSVSAEKSNNGGGNQGNGGGSTNAGNGASNGNAGNNGNGNGGGAAVIVPVPDDQQVVRDAVRARAALPLDAITAIVVGDTDGRILDVQLVTFKGIYLYDVTVLERDGVLHKLYYNARSGARVRTD